MTESQDTTYQVVKDMHLHHREPELPSGSWGVQQLPEPYVTEPTLTQALLYLSLHHI